ncbi:MAG: hypothetical protein GOU98_01115 [Candidatus Altiarchaeota archaeon]|nr:hypothetical protein [Candidatus Altiarchaeota archaeon]
MIGILALGNELRGDDGVGIYVGKELEKCSIPVTFGFSTPENLKEIPYSKIIVVDAAHFDLSVPFLIGKDTISHYTHKPSLDKLAKFFGVEYTVFGIKTYNRELGNKISEQARKNADFTIRVIKVCMAIPGVVVDEGKKVVDLGHKTKQVKFAIPHLKNGDFVLVHAGMVIDKLSEDDYKNAKDALSGLSCE